jgi:hypothetical protein
MATSIEAGFDFKRLPGNTRWGSTAFWRKVSTQDARLAMAEILGRYDKMIRRFKDASPQIIEDAMRPVFKKAQYYVPEDTGNLWASGKLESGRRNSNGRPYARIVFGDESAPYAAIVHEFTWLKHEAPTRSKYLQAAMEEGLDEVLVSLAVDYSGIFG